MRKERFIGATEVEKLVGESGKESRQVPVKSYARQKKRKESPVAKIRRNDFHLLPFYTPW